MKEDPWKPHSNDAYEGKAGEMLNFARARIAFVKCELERGAGQRQLPDAVTKTNNRRKPLERYSLFVICYFTLTTTSL